MKPHLVESFICCCKLAKVIDSPKDKVSEGSQVSSKRSGEKRLEKRGYCRREERKGKTKFVELTMHMDAHIMLKPLHSKGALIDKNKAETAVNGLIAIGDSKSDIDCVPAIKVCAFPCSEV
ncbi:hypothetical protein VNO77_13018 [Canavalia gladiata]|uniref:Uncharacterized protein n=1 Tax=Canavalia gladiata TaxID=3824 RepID=A0AAN9QUS3_CANGL